MSTRKAVHTSTEAYTKSVLHALKYPTQPVIGLLVGKYVNSTSTVGDTAAEVAEDALPSILDCVPLSHTGVLTAPHPLVDVAITIVSEAVKEDGCGIVGLYVCNERLNDRLLSPLLTPLIRQLQEMTPSLPSSTSKDNHNKSSRRAPLLLWMIDNSALTMPPKMPCIISLIVHPQGGDDAAEYLNGKKAVPTIPTQGVQPIHFLAPHPAATPAEKQDKNNNNNKNNNNGKTKPKTANDAMNDLLSGNVNIKFLSSARKTQDRHLHRVELTTAADLLTSAVSSSAHYYLQDFEDHLENPVLPFVDQPLHNLLS